LARATKSWLEQLKFRWNNLKFGWNNQQCDWNNQSFGWNNQFGWSYQKCDFYVVGNRSHDFLGDTWISNVFCAEASEALCPEHFLVFHTILIWCDGCVEKPPSSSFLILKNGSLFYLKTTK